MLAANNTSFTIRGLRFTHRDRLRCISRTQGLFDAPSHRGIVSKLVNAALPCFLFYSVISKFFTR